MDDGMQRENGRHKFDYYKGIAAPWNMMSQHHMREQNALPMNRKILAIISERDAAIHERDIALAEKRQALVDRDAAQKQRDEAISQRNSALMERDNAIAALQYSNELGHGMQRGTKHADHPFDGERRITEALPLSFVTMYDVKSCQAKRTKGRRKAPSSKASRKREDTGEDLNKRIPSNGVVKMRSEWDSHELGLNLITFDESTMPAPICSCTGKARQCYKWGSGGWQSACCTTTLSMYPLPQMLNKRHSRMGGRKMSGNVFTRLLTRLAASGHDLSMPVDLKDHWARHGTNHYIIIK